jgi:Flp pilus assembly pilin Flp
MRKLFAAFRDQRGVETLEWIVVGALIVALGTTVFTFAGTGLQEAITSIVNKVKATAAGS